MTTAFVNGIVFVGDGKVLEHATVLVEGDRIVKVGKAKTSVPKGATKISLDEGMLFPGFIDCHVHLCLDGSPDPMTTLLKDAVPTTTLKAGRLAHKTLMSGVTMVRDMGGKDGIDLCLRDAIRSGLSLGPRMLVSRQMVCMTGGHGWQFGREADGPDEVRKAAREQIRGGADLVKFMATGGVMTPGVEPGATQLTEEELRAGIEEAHKAGRKTATHAMGTQGILNALRAGIDSIEHGVYMNEEAISFMKKKGIPFIPTLSALFHIENKGVEAGIPAYAVEKTLRVKPHHLNSIRMAREAGVMVAAGTDAGTPFNEHGQNPGEMIFLVDQGYSPVDALRAGTSVAARVLGVERDFGTVEEGKVADLVVVKGNPLEDMKALLTSVAVVMQGGKVVRNEL
ncbi:MAG: amidohydrolase family protein [Deltaproteobacteria bacterium]|jgi:imidazolonepropionase-like amidohydrolase|nr:amidohydrolase family protein [Deltaproteobacteria bacterium]NTV55902.1 amidohydrolase family protein [Deltaproteobacteria bacterium]